MEGLAFLLKHLLVLERERKREMKETNPTLMKPNAPFSERDSQISASSCSLSLLSEPPDIRKWFSSYVYESPSLGPNEDFLGSTLEESAHENKGFGVDDREKGGEEEAASQNSNCIRGRDQVGALEFTSNFGSNKHGEESPTEVPESLESSLQISEPPDVREWFLSYVYESPELSEHSREFVAIESECKKEWPVSGEGKKEHESLGEVTKVKDSDVGGTSEAPHNNGLVNNGGGSFMDQEREDQFLTKIADSMSPPLLLSEPPDITNWFSSYVYESPELSMFPGSPVEENGEGNDDLILEEAIGEKEDNQHNSSGDRIDGGMGINERLNSALCSSSHEDLKQEYQQIQDEVGNKSKEDKCLVPQIPSPEIVDGRMESKALLDNDQDCKSKRPKQLHSEEAICFPSNINWNSSNDKRKARRELIGGFEEVLGVKAQSREVTHTLLEDNLGLSPVDQASMRRSTHGDHDKENNRRNNDSTDFVSVRRKETTSASDKLMRPRSTFHQCSCAKGNALLAAIEDDAKMRPLSEITNFRSNFDVQECAGNWKCPQKRKPILGPPMKQLRLERWINRI